MNGTHSNPNSPTIRVNGQDVEPGFTACDDCAPRCRLYFVDGRLAGVPAREWIARALRSARLEQPPGRTD